MASVHHAPAVPTTLRAAAVPPLAMVLAALAMLTMQWPVSAQAADRPPVRIPDLTITAEDPLILLPPLGPPVNEAPLAVPPARPRQAAYTGAPAITAPGFGPPPAPGAVLRVARAVQAVERSAEFTATAGVVGIDALHGIPAAISYRSGGPMPMVDLRLTGLVPMTTDLAGDVAAHAVLESPAWRGAIAGALTVADPDRAGQVALSGAAGPVSGTLTVQHWQVPPDPAVYRLALAVEAALSASRSGPQASAGVAAGRTGDDLFVLPSARLHYAGKSAWQVAAGVRPMLGYPRWLHHLIRDEPAGTASLRPAQAWLAWLGGGVGAIDLRAGWAHGLSRGFTAERAAGAAGADLVLLGMAVEADWNSGTGGPVTVSARAGANWDRTELDWRLQAAGEWQVAAAPPITLLLGARWLGSRAYYGVYAGEDWTLGPFRDEPGSAVIGGVRWAPAWGHGLSVTGGVHSAPEGDLTWGIGIEYARDVVRLTAPP